ncbi:proline dehydrogenase 1, mitochondrial isoform X1 [Trichoplusia ni]|uniref:Proline dehydrogenase n=1 Tax=Trichoplusia ni TaxID=7111 RepID=A0A7E5WJN1_TRINI|nr:proline dehydrogenase 1, mitochondrial isoform X1 [Trichoplusia ni]
MALLRRLAVNAPRSVRVLSSSPSSRVDDLDLNFNSPKDAFKSKKTSELVRAYFVYQICSVNWLVENNDMLMKRLRQVVGQRLFEMFMKATFYGQFVAGEDQNTIKPTIERLRSFGVKSILDYSVEEDLSQEEAEKREVSGSLNSEQLTELLKHGTGNFQEFILTGASISACGDKQEEGQLKQYHVEQRFADRRYKVTSARTYFYLNEASCEKNMEAFLKSIDAVAGITKSTGLMAIKLTALGRPQLLLQLSEVIMRARNYMQQIGGGTGNVLTHHKTIEDFQRYFGDHSSKPQVQEFMKKITSDKEGIVHLFPWSNILDEDMNLSDSFRVPDPKTGQMRRLISQISPKEEEMFRNMLRRLNHIIRIANDADVRIMIDAEQTYFQPAISRICLEMMRRYNKDKFLVFNTYQTYLKNTYQEILTDLEQAQRQNFYWGAKLVRGAYIEQERARAAAMGYEDPTCESVDATTVSFHKCLKEILSRVKGPNKERLGIMVASHNEDTVRYAIQLMKEHDIKPEDKVVCFGQLLGMCDHITFPLGQAGYSAYKYVPYGPVVEVLPYLSRRANENRGFLKKIKKEKKLILKEIVRRVATGQMFYKPDGHYTPV